MNMDPRLISTPAKRSLDVVLHLLPQAARDLREVLRYALTIPAAEEDKATSEERNQFAHQEVVLDEFYAAVDAMRNNQWGAVGDRLKKLIAECETLRASIELDAIDEAIRKTRGVLDGNSQGSQPAKDEAHGDQG